MKEKIENKIKAHINSILEKDAIDFADYQILTSELCKIKAEENEKEWEAGENKRKEENKEMLESLMKSLVK